MGRIWHDTSCERLSGANQCFCRTRVERAVRPLLGKRFPCPECGDSFPIEHRLETGRHKNGRLYGPTGERLIELNRQQQLEINRRQLQEAARG